MPVLQDLIHKVEVGGGLRYLKVGLVVMVILVVFLGYNFRGFRNMSTQEAMDSAQLGRNIAEGKGYTTQFVRPFSMYLLRQHNQQKPGAMDLRNPQDATQIKDRHPDLANPPLYPVLLAGLMKILPFHFAIPSKATNFWSPGGMFWRYQPDFLISLFNQLLFFIVLIMVFFLVRRVFEPRVAWLSAFLIFGTEILWRFCVSGLSTMLLILLFTGLVWCLVIFEQQAREPTGGQGRLIVLAILAGVLAGLGGLTRYSFAWLILPVLLYVVLFGGPQRFVLTALALVSFTVVLGPWVARNIQVSGTPFGTAGYAVFEAMPPFPEHTLQRSLEPDLGAPFLRPFTQKLLTNCRQLCQSELPKLGGGWIAGFFAVSLLVGFRDAGPRRLRYFLMSCLVVLSLVQVVGRTQLSEDSPDINSENLLVVLAPLVMVYGVSLFYLFLDQFDIPLRELRFAAIGLFGLLICLPMAFTFLPPKTQPIVYPPYHPPAIQLASGWTLPNELTMSDMPWAVAWYGQSQCIWLTMNVDAFVDINDTQKPIQALYLTRLTTDRQWFSFWIHSDERSWGSLLLQAYISTPRDQNWPKKVGYIIPQSSPSTSVGFFAFDPRSSKTHDQFFPLHFLQAGWPEQFLLTARQHWPKTP